MLKRLLSVWFFFSSLAFAPGAEAAAPTCQTHSSGPFCKYSGTVSKAYVNSSNSILLNFDSPMDLAAPASVGIGGITKATAALISLTDTPDFAKAAYATMLSAQARGMPVSVQMRGNHALPAMRRPLAGHRQHRGAGGHRPDPRAPRP